MKKVRFFYCVFMFSFSLLYGQKNDVLNFAEFVWHNPVAEIYCKNLTNQFMSLCKIDISDKLYIIRGLSGEIIRFNEKPLSNKDTTEYEKSFCKLLKGVDSLNNIKRIVALTMAIGDNSVFCDYVFIETKDNSFCHRNNCGRDTIVSRQFNSKALSVFLDYLKKHTVPDKKYRRYLSSERWFNIYEITKDAIYANKFYTTEEFEFFFKSIGID